MASSVKHVSSDDQGLRCPICLDVYTAPDTLPCTHSYCYHSICKHIVNNVSKGKNDTTFNCPECRKETFPTLPDIPVDKWTEHCPFNSALLSALPTEKWKDDKSCDSCLYEGTPVRATRYCTVCKEALCLICEKVHRKNKATRDHAVINVKDLVQDVEQAVSLSVSITSSEDVGKEFEHYSISHISMCSSECFCKGHIGCRDVVQIKDHSQRFLKEKEATTSMDRLKQLKSHLDQFKNENKESFEKIEDELKDMPNEIELLRKKLNILLDNVKAKITMEKDDLLKKETIVRHEENQNCESFSLAVTNSLHLLQTALAHGNPLHILTTLHNIEEQLVHYESAVKVKYCDVRHVDAKLCIDDRLLSLFIGSEINFAKINIVDKKHKLTPLLPLSKETTVTTTTGRHDASQAVTQTIAEQRQTQNFLSSKPLTDCRPERNGEFNADYIDGQYVCYCGITCLSDGKILLLDCLNCICRLYDSSHRHLADYKLTSHPWAVCLVEGYLVAVTLPEEQKIQLLTVNNSIQRRGIIFTNLKCYGIAALSGDQLVVSGNRNDILYWCVVSMGGSEKLTVQVCPTKSCGSLAVNNNRTRIYVSCYDAAAVYAYNVDGTLIFKYEHKALVRARGAAVDRGDNLYVVSAMHHNIHQVSPNGVPLQVFSTEIPKSLYAICFTSSGDEFLLTGETTKLVQKFKLK